MDWSLLKKDMTYELIAQYVNSNIEIFIIFILMVHKKGEVEDWPIQNRAQNSGQEAQNKTSDKMGA